MNGLAPNCYTVHRAATSALIPTTAAKPPPTLLPAFDVGACDALDALLVLVVVVVELLVDVDVVLVVLVELSEDEVLLALPEEVFELEEPVEEEAEEEIPDPDELIVKTGL